MTNKSNRIKRIVFTGGPCSGKTTLLESLQSNGLAIIPETARIVIEEEQKRDSDCLPWRNLYSFQKRVARLQREQEHSYHEGILLQDRGIIDGHGYALRGKVETPEIIRKIGRGRYSLVLSLDAIPNYKTDESRKESAEEAKIMHKQIEQAYREFGYPVYRIPIIKAENVELAIEKRADYVINLLERWGI